jgi:hypothetical protein
MMFSFLYSGMYASLSPCPRGDIKGVSFNKVCGEDENPKEESDAETARISHLPASQKIEDKLPRP